VYCLLVLRTVRSEDAMVFVPQLSATVALLLAVVSVAVLIYFIHHVVSSLQVENLVASIADELVEAIDHLFPEHLGRHLDVRPNEPQRLYPELEQPAWQVAAPRAGYVQAVDNEGLMELAVEHGLVLCLVRRPGSFVGARIPVLEVRPAERRDDALGESLARMFAIGRHRTPTQDVDYPAQQVVSVALRALSPAVNDPLTAMICVDWLGHALLRFAGRKIPSMYRSDSAGRLRVVALPTDFVELADLIFNPIRRAARQHPAVLLRMLETLHAVSLQAVRQEDRRAIGEHADRIMAEARDAGFDRAEREKMEARHRHVVAGLAGRDRGGSEDNGWEVGSDSV
jgi:uncharacterized membrane protein